MNSLRINIENYSASFEVLSIILVGKLYFSFFNDDLDRKNHKETGYENHFVRPLSAHLQREISEILRRTLFDISSRVISRGIRISNISFITNFSKSKGNNCNDA